MLTSVNNQKQINFGSQWEGLEVLRRNSKMTPKAMGIIENYVGDAALFDGWDIAMHFKPSVNDQLLLASPARIGEKPNLENTRNDIVAWFLPNDPISTLKALIRKSYDEITRRKQIRTESNPIRTKEIKV